MHDLIWLKGGPADGRVVEAEVGPDIIVPIWTLVGYDVARYRVVGEHEDGVVAEYVGR